MAEAAGKRSMRSAERRRAAQAARHFRDVEDLTIAEIARRLGKAPGTIRAYLYDPTGEKARTVKARYRGTCERCGNPTSGGDGKGRARRRCRRCLADARRVWDRDSILEAMVRWERAYGKLPSSTDWSPTKARRRGGEHARRLREGRWPSLRAVNANFGSWQAARQALAERD